MSWEIVMGLEVHTELSTQSKIFCGCSTQFGGEPNTHVCPVCAGMPGTLPRLNRDVVERAIRTGLALNCEITRLGKFDRKNYFYPDLPKAYQVSQLYFPICRNGSLEIETEAGGKKTIGIREIHMEEDAGKLVHDSRSGGSAASLMDFNRCGVPLLEIVSQPDFRTGEEVIAYLNKLRKILLYLGVSDCKMQEGSIRADVNLSVRKSGGELGRRTETKNLNSLRAISRAIEYESERQIEILEKGGEVLQETRGWDDDAGESFAMRSKEDAHDYRYFPEPDLLPLEIDDTWIEAVRLSLPEMEQEKFKRLTEVCGLSEYDSGIITGSKNLADIFDETMKHFNKPKEVANWIIGELLAAATGGAATGGTATGENKNADDVRIDCVKFARLIELADSKKINRTQAKKILPLVLNEGVDPAAYVEEHALGMVSDTSAITAVVQAVLSDNAKVVADYKNGNQKVMAFLVGQVMKRLGGKADPQIVNSVISEFISR